MTDNKLDIVALEKEHSAIMAEIKDKMSELVNLSRLPLGNDNDKGWFKTNDDIQELFASAKKVADQMKISINKVSDEKEPKANSLSVVLWPDNMMYKVEATYRTWPMGWDKEPNVVFVQTESELQADLEKLRKWALCEDNEVRIEVYKNTNKTVIAQQYHYY